jgi:hypothetical protein
MTDKIANPGTAREVDLDAIRAALALILGPGQATELRALDAVTAADRRPHVEAGYFDDPEKLAGSVSPARNTRPTRPAGRKC